MNKLQRVRGFVDRYPLAGPIVWVLCVQFFLVQVIVASAWERLPYSWRGNSISDLAATNCGTFDDRFVCSPSHGLMGVSLILLGLCMAIGSVLIYQLFRKARTGFYLMGLAGIGAIIVGFFPENANWPIHLLGADLAFLLSNIALIVFGRKLRMPSWFRVYSVVSGVVALTGLVLFLSHMDLFLGLGGMERVVAFPMVIWQIVMGLYMLNSRNRAALHSKP